MRVIVNIHCDEAAKIAGWRAKAVEVSKKSRAKLDQVLLAVPLKNGQNMHELIVADGCILSRWILIVNGIPVSSKVDLDLEVRDSVQVHLMPKK